MRLVGWMLLLAIVSLAAWWAWGGRFDEIFSVQATLRLLERSGPWAWLIGIGLLVSDLALPVPGTLVISSLGLVYGTVVGGLIASAGLMAAGMTGYAIGRCLGEERGRRWLGEKDWRRGRRLFENGGGWMVAASRTLPILPEVISCTAGLVRMPFRRFVVSLACGSLPMGMVFAWVGSTGRESPGWAAAWSVVLPVVLWAVARRFENRA